MDGCIPAGPVTTAAVPPVPANLGMTRNDGALTSHVRYWLELVTASELEQTHVTGPILLRVLMLGMMLMLLM